MALNTKTAISALFQTGDVPTQANYEALMDLVFSAQGGGSRPALAYNAAQSVKFFNTYVSMSGFRYRGQHIGARGPTLPMPTSKIATLPGDLAGYDSTNSEQWYAVFAVADAGDTAAVLKIVPFFRVGSVSGSVVSLVKYMEADQTPADITYEWTTTDNLDGVDCLVISEAGNHGDRVTTITANGNSHEVTLGTVGSIAADDILLHAPPGFDYYHYLGSFYRDTGEVRNIYDSGTWVASLGVALDVNGASVAASVASRTEISCLGNIAPLATAVELRVTCNYSTSSTGDFADYFSPDSSAHDVQTRYRRKGFTSTETVQLDAITIPFLYPQSFWYSNAGSLISQRSGGSFAATAWLEP